MLNLLWPSSWVPSESNISGSNTRGADDFVSFKALFAGLTFEFGFEDFGRTTTKDKKAS